MDNEDQDKRETPIDWQDVTLRQVRQVFPEGSIFLGCDFRGAMFIMTEDGQIPIKTESPNPHTSTTGAESLLSALGELVVERLRQRDIGDEDADKHQLEIVEQRAGFLAEALRDMPKRLRARAVGRVAEILGMPGAALDVFDMVVPIRYRRVPRHTDDPKVPGQEVCES